MEEERDEEGNLVKSENIRIPWQVLEPTSSRGGGKSRSSMVVIVSDSVQEPTIGVINVEDPSGGAHWRYQS